MNTKQTMVYGARGLWCAFAVMLALALALATTACGGDDGPLGGPPGGPPPGPGTFTLTGIPAAYDGKFAALVTPENNYAFLGVQSISTEQGAVTIKAVPISNRSASIPMWYIPRNTGGGEPRWDESIRFDGNNKLSVEVWILENETYQGTSTTTIDEAYYDQVQFLFGSTGRLWEVTTPGTNGVFWSWYPWNDASEGGTSTIAISKAMNQWGGAITISGNITLTAGPPGGNKYGYVGVSVIPNADGLTDLKSAQSISFKVQGDGKTYRLVAVQSDITEGNYYQGRFTASSSETTFTVNLSSSGGGNTLTQPSWGTPKTFDKSKVTHIDFMTDDQISQAQSYSLTVRDITLTPSW